MDEQIVLYVWNEILLSNKKKQSTETYNMVNIIVYTKSKRSEKDKEYRLYKLIYTKFQKMQKYSTVIESTIVVQ